ncbi:hypothetical protein J1N35_002058 [Gossypium stocksii]|uniref:DUF4283 domain-containing protein n=1 Tax=Gossypium stocksii TaxID=47602 RepID=A0A9D4AK75_9ROSI|nr:hypothetical protein J1N35_002058 [Gossypium stocksii]
MISGGPRSFNNCILFIHKLEKGEDPEKVEFFSVDFWVQVHDLPTGFASKSLAKSLGNVMGEFLEYDANGHRNFMRIWARLYIQEPLMRKRKSGSKVMNFLRLRLFMKESRRFVICVVELGIVKKVVIVFWTI